MRREVNIVKSIDWFTVGIYLALILMGWINIYAAVFDEDYRSILSFSQRYGKQLYWIVTALVFAAAILIIDKDFYLFFSYPVYIFFILFLVSVLLFGKEVNGARSWFEIGSIRIQPAEFAKFATCLAVAKYISSANIKKFHFFNLVIIGLLVLSPAAMILLQNDTGSAIVYVAFIVALYREGLSGTFLVMGIIAVALFLMTFLMEKLTIVITLTSIALLIFWGTRLRIKETGIAAGILVVLAALLWGIVKLFSLHYSLYYCALGALVPSCIFFAIFAIRKKIRHVVVIVVILLGSITFTYSVDYIFNKVMESHQKDRINILLGLKTDPKGTGYNVNQSQIAIGSGGFLGKGFLQGTQTKYNFVPEQSTDFIFCTVGEEWGFVGSSVVLLLFVILFLRLIVLAERQRSTFSRVYGYGVVSIMFFHVLVNVGMTIGVVPVIGIPLPFFSYGGSSLWAFTILLFIFIRLDASRLELLR